MHFKLGCHSTVKWEISSVCFALEHNLKSAVFVQYRLRQCAFAQPCIWLSSQVLPVLLGTLFLPNHGHAAQQPQTTCTGSGVGLWASLCQQLATALTRARPGAMSENPQSTLCWLHNAPV